jgi:hypothetical protein
MDGENSSKQIKRIRTFQDDMAFARTLQADNKTSRTKPEQAKPEIPVLTDAESVEPAHTEASFVETKTSSLKTPIQSGIEHRNLKSTTLERELKKVAAIQKASILTDTDAVYNNADSFDGGMIIRDTKRNRFNVIIATGKALIASVQEIVHGYKEKHKAPTITNADERKDVIEKATQLGEHAPVEDFQEVAERLKQVERKPIETAISFKAKEEMPEPEWSYVTQDEAQNAKLDAAQAQALDLLNKETEVSSSSLSQNVAAREESDMLEDVPVVMGTQAAQEALVEHEAQREQVIDDALQVLFEDSEKPKEETFLTETATVSTPHTTKEESGFDVPQDQVTAQNTSPFEEPSVAPIYGELLPPVTNSLQASNVHTEQYRSASLQRRPIMPALMFFGVILFASLGGVYASYYFLVLKEAPVQAHVFSVPVFVQTLQTKTFTLPAEGTLLLQEIKAAIASTQGVSHVYPVVHERGMDRPANAEEIGAALGTHIPTSLERNIEEYMFGGIEGKTPYIILRGTNFDSLFAGMLTWETSLADDLATLFTSTEGVSSTFKDVISSNRNMRVQSDRNGEDIVVYTFINQNTLMITTSRSMMDQLLPLVK